MKKYFRTNPIGDHCFYGTPGFGLIMIYGIIVCLFCAIAAFLIHPILYVCSIIALLGSVVMFFYARWCDIGEVHATSAGVVIKNGTQTTSVTPWAQIYNIDYHSWTSEGHRYNVAYATLKPLTAVERDLIRNSRDSVNNPRKKSESSWIYLCSGDENTVKQAVQLMHQWKQEFTRSAS